MLYVILERVLILTAIENCARANNFNEIIQIILRNDAGERVILFVLVIIHVDRIKFFIHTIYIYIYIYTKRLVFLITL